VKVQNPTLKVSRVVVFRHYVGNGELSYHKQVTSLLVYLRHGMSRHGTRCWRWIPGCQRKRAWSMGKWKSHEHKLIIGPRAMSLMPSLLQKPIQYIQIDAWILLPCALILFFLTPISSHRDTDLRWFKQRVTYV
jgi:hypothetical protein